jgi:hypothetical protein
MKLLLSAFATMLALWSFTPEAHASACANDQYMHNGSVMEVQICDGGSLTISYAQPRPGMAKVGARPGSLLFNGVIGTNGFITGQSRSFSARCGVIAYDVTGNQQGGDTYVMNGSAPIRGNGCRVVRYRQDNLVFTPAAGGGGGGGPQTAQPSCPPGFYFNGSQCLRQNAGPAPRPQPVPQPLSGGNAGDWYAIAISTKSRNAAQNRANALGPGWKVMNTNQCPNFRNGYWIATAGGFSKSTAQLYVNQAGGDSYRKSCR